MGAVESLLNGLIDYAGLYPPEALDMQTAVRNYLAYRATKHEHALGRFIVDFKRLQELRQAAGAELHQIPLSVIVPGRNEIDELSSLVREFRIESVEMKCDEPLKIARLCEQIPNELARYFEISLSSGCSSAIDAVAAVGARAKLRMGGIVPEAFPTPELLVRALHTLGDRGVAFKATAGLHHPVRGSHRLTHAADAQRGVMHGFLNLFCAACSLYFGAAPQTALRILEEQEVSAFAIAADFIAWRDLRWDFAQMETVRDRFFVSYGSCSFLEPLQDLEAMRWL